MCWNKGRLCWKIAKLFYICHLKKLVRPETSGPYYVCRKKHGVLRFRPSWAIKDFFQAGQWMWIHRVRLHQVFIIKKKPIQFISCFVHQNYVCAAKQQTSSISQSLISHPNSKTLSNLISFFHHSRSCYWRQTIPVSTGTPMDNLV